MLKCVGNLSATKIIFGKMVSPIHLCTHLLISDAAFTGESYTILSPAKPTSKQFKISPIDAHSAPRPFQKIENQVNHAI